MSVRRQRATTSKTYAMDMCYSKVLADAKRIHRSDGKFYIDKIGKSFCSVSVREFSTNAAYSERNLEEWTFINGRWHKSVK